MSNNFSISIYKENTPLVEIKDFNYTENKITFLFGESGIGKTLISKAIYGLIDPDDLTVNINGEQYSQYLEKEETRQIHQNSFFVFQEPSSHLNPLMKLSSQLNEGSINGDLNEEETLKLLWNGVDKKLIDQIMKVYPKPYRPSGGEKQRVLAAMAFKKIEKYLKANDNTKTLFVFDEPTGSLDNMFRNIFLKMLLEKFRTKNFTAILITHDYSMISEIYSSHSDLNDSIEFKELQRQKGELVLTDFKPEEYLDWIESIKEKRGNDIKTAEKIFSIKSGIKVFGKELTLRRKGESIEELALHKGEAVYLKAGSGVGKTTVAKIIMGLQPCDKFDAEIAGIKLNETTERAHWMKELWGRKMTMAFQHADEALNLKSKVKDVLKGLPIESSNEESFLISKLEELFNIEADQKYLDKRISQLSGGQKQKLNLLRCLVLDTDLLILDEPVSGMDFKSIQTVISVIDRKKTEGKGILLISHNEEIFDSIIPDDSVYQLVSI